jgi:deoxyribodipyrimidine photo-lyase
MAIAPIDQRVHAPLGSKPRPGGEFVLYWMQTTMRAHDNFALNFAIEQANELSLPVVVYHGLRHDYPWASDRLHTWILESVADLYADFAAKGIQYGFWLDQSRGEYTEWPAGREASGVRRQAPGGDTGPTPDARRLSADWSPLVALARRAALVVTDFFPTFIVPRQIKGLRAKVETAVIAVESATVVPMAYHQKEHSTARGIRPILMDALPHFLWAVENPEPKVRRPVELGFEPTMVAERGREKAKGEGRKAIGDLVATCDVDHSVPPSTTFHGGTRAGRARLQEFLTHGLGNYAEDRNDPNRPAAVSQLSPWLHFGNLSIHEVLLAARDAGPADQYARFLDEALTWRELAHNFCYFNPRHRTAHAIPEWARRELSQHEGDPRPHLYSMEEMEQAATGEPLWNAAQRAYLREGWMHNYMRMLWGKTVLQWTPNAAECLRVLEHLNNKYSLDGRDPNSYGGILWIFGKFDRPFYRRPIYGTVRYQSLRAAQEKFDVAEYCRRYGSDK